jgi:hypothetical protein
MSDGTYVSRHACRTRFDLPLPTSDDLTSSNSRSSPQTRVSEPTTCRQLCTVLTADAVSAMKTLSTDSTHHNCSIVALSDVGRACRALSHCRKISREFMTQRVVHKPMRSERTPMAMTFQFSGGSRPAIRTLFRRHPL